MKWADMSKQLRRAWAKIWLFAPLGFLAAGVALSGIAAFREGAGLAGVIGVGLALVVAYWLGRRSRGDQTAVAVAQAVAEARAEATAEATAAAQSQAMSNVQLVFGPEGVRALQDAERGAVYDWDEATEISQSVRSHHQGLVEQNPGLRELAAGARGAPQDQPEAARQGAAKPWAGASGDAGEPSKRSRVGATVADNRERPNNRVRSTTADHVRNMEDLPVPP